MKKIITLLLALNCILCSFTGCSSATDDLINHGMDIVEMMEEMTNSQSYKSMYSSLDDNSYEKKISDGDYTKPNAVYQLNLDVNDLLNVSNINSAKFSYKLDTYVKNRAYSSFSSIVNMNESVDALSVSSMYSSSKTFVFGISDTVVFLYTFNPGIPIVISFCKGEDDTVDATGYFVFLDDKNEEEIKEDLTKLGIGCTVSKIK